MTEDAQEHFIRRQLAALAQLGLDAEALAREEALLRRGFDQAGLLAVLAEKFAAP